MFNNGGEILNSVDYKLVKDKSNSRSNEQRKKRHDKNIHRLIRQCSVVIYVLSLSNDELINVNEIHRRAAKIGKEKSQTGLQYKRNIVDTIKILEKNRIVETNKEGQAVFVNLTALGKEIGNMIKDGQEYIGAYFEFVDIIKKNILIVEQYNLYLFDLRFIGYPKDQENIRNNCIRKLKDKGWKDDEIVFYNKIRTTILELKFIFDTNFINILIIRYAMMNEMKLPENIKFIRTHELPTKEAKEIISNLLLTLIGDKIQYILDNMAEEIFYGQRIIKDIIKKEDPLKSEYDIGSRFNWFFNVYDIFETGAIPLMIEKTLKKMLLSYFFLLRPPITNLDFPIGDFIDKVRIQSLNLQKYDPDQPKDIIMKNYTKVKLRGMIFFLTTYKEYCIKIAYKSMYIDYIDQLIKDPSSLPTDISPYSFLKDNDMTRDFL